MDTISKTAKKLFDNLPKRTGKNVVELRSLTHGLPPKAVKGNLELFVEEWRVNGVDAWNEMTESAGAFLVGDEKAEERNRRFGWWMLPEIIGDRFISRVLDVPAGTCIMMSNATQIVFSLLSCKELNKPGKRKVVCTDGEFPAVLHTLHHFNRQFSSYPESVRTAVQLDIYVAAMEEGRFDERKILHEIDESTALVIFSHVGFVRGERVPDAAIKKIVEKAHAKGALVAVDGYHALGNRTLHVQDLGVDAYFGGLLKEGCGSSGNCFLYVRPDLALTPSLSGWFGDSEPFAFAPKPSSHHSVRRRFLTGTTPIAPMYHAVEGLKIMLRLGLEKVEKNVLDKVDAMTKRFQDAGLTVVSPLDRERMSSLVVLKVPEADRLRDYLIKKSAIFTDARRNTFLRLAAHVYNSEKEIAQAAETIVEALQNKHYLKFDVKKKVGPVT